MKTTTRLKKIDGWYQKKNYPHFDLPLSYKKALRYVSTAQKIELHGFLPFLSFEIETRRFRRSSKTREINYASHRDGYIFSYYAKSLSELYEETLASKGLTKAVLAYRAGLGDNIDFAKTAFDEIERIGDCVAIGFDIENFFGSIDHAQLKMRWKTLLGQQSLPRDHYSVFRAITKYSYVDREACYKRLRYTRKQRQESRPICSIDRFRSEIKGRNKVGWSLVQKNLKSYGIPQGSSISALLANVYMLPFDEEMCSLAERLEGTYYRYSDDILWLAPADKADVVVDAVMQAVKSLGSNFNVQSEKTTVSHFVRDSCGKVVLAIGSKPLQYLGFVFSGKQRLIRSQTLSRYWRKVIIGVKKAKKDANNAALKNRNPKIFRRKLYHRFTHLGPRNFLTYSKRAAKTMASNTSWKQHSIWTQVKRHWDSINQKLN